MISALVNNCLLCIVIQECLVSEGKHNCDPRSPLPSPPSETLSRIPASYNVSLLNERMIGFILTILFHTIYRY